MTPEEKAKELDNKMFRVILKNQSYLTNKSARKQSKACAIICVDEMLTIQNDFYGLVLTPEFRERVRKRVEYLEQVKQSLNKTL